MTAVRDDSRNVMRSPRELRMHPALEEAGFCAFLPELQDTARCHDLVLPEQPVGVTHTGVVMSEFGRWRTALSQQVPAIECREHTLSDEEALQFMLGLQKRQSRWNPYIRIRLALKLEETLRQRALNNMQMGGKFKGSATLPKASQIDVREQLGAIAGVGGRNVSKVKEIVGKAHPRILSELANGSIAINHAHQLCRLPFAKQVEALTEKYCDEVADGLEKDLLWQSREKSPIDAMKILKTLGNQEKAQPGSVSIRTSRSKRSLILLGEDIRSQLRESRGDLDGHEI